MVLYIWYGILRSSLQSGVRQERAIASRFVVRMPTATILTLLRLGRNEIPVAKVETMTRARHGGSRDRLFIPSTAWPELAAVVAAGVWGRSVGLWLAIRMQAKLEGQDWIRVRTHLRESLGFTNRAAHSRSVTELERAGLIEVQRRRG